MVRISRNLFAEKLPPLSQVPGSITERVADRQCTQLLRGLKSLGGEKESRSAKTSQALQKGFLDPIMPASRKANECIEEVEGELICAEMMAERSQFGSLEDGAGDALKTIANVKQSFKTIVDEIDAVLHGGSESTRTIRHNETLHELVPPRGLRYYKIPLPSRPTEVAVSVVQNSGITPLLWGSTSYDKPCSTHFEIKGHSSRIVYRHMIHPTNTDEDLAIDRRRAVPSCRELAVTLEAQCGECDVHVHFSFTRINVVLCRHELAAHIAKMKQNWATRLNELQKEPQARAEFELSLVDIHKKNRRKIHELARGANFIRENIEAACDERPQVRKILHKHKIALQHFARHDAASNRRAQMSARSTRCSESAWIEESRTHLSPCDLAAVAGKRAAVEREQSPALPST